MLLLGSVAPQCKIKPTHPQKHMQVIVQDYAQEALWSAHPNDASHNWANCDTAKASEHVTDFRNHWQMSHCFQWHQCRSEHSKSSTKLSISYEPPNQVWKFKSCCIFCSNWKLWYSLLNKNYSKWDALQPVASAELWYFRRYTFECKFHCNFSSNLELFDRIGLQPYWSKCMGKKKPQRSGRKLG